MKTKRIISFVLAVMMIFAMVATMAVSAGALDGDTKVKNGTLVDYDTETTVARYSSRLQYYEGLDCVGIYNTISYAHNNDIIDDTQKFFPIWYKLQLSYNSPEGSYSNFTREKAQYMTPSNRELYYEHYMSAGTVMVSASCEVEVNYRHKVDGKYYNDNVYYDGASYKLTLFNT